MKDSLRAPGRLSATFNLWSTRPVQYRERSDRMPHSIFSCDSHDRFVECGTAALRSRYCTGGSAQFDFCAKPFTTCPSLLGHIRTKAMYKRKHLIVVFLALAVLAVTAAVLPKTGRGQEPNRAIDLYCNEPPCDAVARGRKAFNDRNLNQLGLQGAVSFAFSN